MWSRILRTGWAFVWRLCVGLPSTLINVTNFYDSPWFRPLFTSWLDAQWVANGLWIISALVFVWAIIASIAEWRKSKTVTGIAPLAEQDSASLLPPLEIIDVREEAGEPNIDRGWGLVVKNPNTTRRATECTARIEKIAPESVTSLLSLADMPMDRPLHWAEARSNAIDIPGGMAARLDVAYREQQDRESIVTLAYEGNDTFRRKHYLPPFDESILVRLSITYDGSAPQYVVCRLNL